MLNCRACSLDLFRGGFGESVDQICSAVKSIFNKESASEQRREMISRWRAHMHPRSDELARTNVSVDSLLDSIAEGICDQNCPLLSSEDNCVMWNGPVGSITLAPAVTMNTTAGEKLAYVTRVLVFLFGIDKYLMQTSDLPEGPLRTTCGNKLCVSFHHIDFESVWEQSVSAQETTAIKIEA